MPKPKVSTKSKVDKEKVNQIKNSAERKQIVKEAKVKAVQNRNARQFAPIKESIPTITPFDVAKVEQMNDAINLKLLGTDSAKFVDEMARAQRALDENRQRVQNADPYRVDALKGYGFGDSISTLADNSFVPTLDKRYQVAGLGDPKLSKTTHQATDQLFTEHPEFSSDEDLINYYESIPNYNPFQRWFKKYDHDENGNLVDMDERTNTKQALDAEYQRAINNRNLQTLFKSGVTEDDINAYLEHYGDVNDPVFNQASRKMGASGLSVAEYQNAIKEYRDNYERNYAKEHPVLSTVNSFVTNPMESAYNVGTNVGRYVSGKPLRIDTNMTGNIRDAVSEDMGALGKIGYGALTSIGDMGTAMALGGGIAPISATLMGLEKANNTMDDAIARGLNPNQIMGEAVASGVSTAITEAIPMGKWSELAETGLTSYTAKEIAKHVGASFAAEGLQEMSEDVVDAIADAFIAGDKSAINLQIAELQAQGFSIEEASRKVWGDWLLNTAIDGLIGGLSGSAMGGANIALGYMNNPNARTQNETDLNPLAEQNLVNDVENALINEEITNSDVNNLGLDNSTAYRDSLIKTTNSTPAPSNNQNNIPTMEQSNRTASFNSVQNAEVPNIDRQYQPQGGETYVSQTATNTGRRSETFFNRSKESAEFLDKEMAKDRFTKNRVSEVDSIEAAKRMVDENRELAERTILESPNVSQVQIDAAAILIDDYISKNDMERAGRLMDAVVEKTHNAAQVLQALAKYTRTATGTMLKAKKLAKIATDNFLKTTKGKVAHSKIQTALNNIGRTIEPTGQVEQTYESIREDVRRALTQELASVDNFTDADVDYIAWKIQGGISTNELTKLLETRIATGSFGMSDADIQEIIRLFDEADKYGPNSRKANELHQKAYAIAAKYIGEPTFMDKWNAWRYLAMLGNPRTHIRNIVGNVAFGAVTDFKDNIAAYIEEAVDKASKNGIDRTKAKVDRNTDKALFDASDKDFEDNAFAIATDANKWDERSEIERQRKVFGEKGFGGAVQKYNDISNTGLDVEDVTAIKRKYVRAMAGYLKANGKTGAVLNSDAEADVAFAKKARDYAIEQARIATFHERNAAAQFISNMSRTAANSDSKIVRGLGMLIESAFPFKNTPANILKQGAIEYNPLQLINALYQTGKYKVETNMGIDTSMTPAEIIDTYARGLTGTGIFALGALLASVGMLRGKKDDNDDLFNEQGYSINIGNKSYTIDWLAPSALPLFMGAEIYNSLQDEDVDSVMDVILSIGEPVIEMSMLSGLSNTLDSIAYAENGGTKATSAIANLAVGYLSQGIPTIGGQIARSVDKTRRDTYTGLPSGGFGDTVMRQVKKDLNKIPGLSFLNQPYVNAYGETEENVGGNFFGRLAYNMLSPGYYKEQNLNPLQEELKRLDSDESIETNFLPTRPNKSYDGDRLSPEDYTNYTQAVGGNYTDISNALISDPNYQTLSDADKAEVLDKVKGFSNAKAKHDLFDADYSSTYSKMAEAYESGDIDGVVQYLMSSSLLDSAGIDKNSALGKELLGQDDLTAEEIEDIIGMSFADQQASQDKIADAVPTLDMGLPLTGSGSSARIDVENAIPYLEDLGLDDATQGEILYNNGRRSQKEIDAYNDMGGYEGVKQYYDIQYNGKTHGTSSVTKDETIIYLKSLGLSVEEINRWLAILGWKPDYDG